MQQSNQNSELPSLLLPLPSLVPLLQPRDGAGILLDFIPQPLTHGPILTWPHPDLPTLAEILILNRLNGISSVDESNECFVFSKLFRVVMSNFASFQCIGMKRGEVWHREEPI